MEQPQSSLPYSQAPATCPYREPTPSSPHNRFPLPERKNIPFYILNSVYLWSYMRTEYLAPNGSKALLEFHLYLISSWMRFCYVNLLATDFFFQILAHPVFKMWVIQKPNKVALWNKWHFEEKKCRLYSMFKIFNTDICWINIKWGI